MKKYGIKTEDEFRSAVQHAFSGVKGCNGLPKPGGFSCVQMMQNFPITDIFKQYKKKGVKMASPDEYCELINLMPDIDPAKVSKAEVVLFYCDFMEQRVLTDYQLIDWNIYAQDKAGLLELIELTRKFVDNKAPFKKLEEFKARFKKWSDYEAVENLYLIWRVIWPFTFDFNKSEEDSLEWFDLFWDNIPDISVDLWRDLVVLVKVRFHGRLLDNS